MENKGGKRRMYHNNKTEQKIGQLRRYDGGSGHDEGEDVNMSSASCVTTQVVVASAAITTGMARAWCFASSCCCGRAISVSSSSSSRCIISLNRRCSPTFQITSLSSCT